MLVYYILNAYAIPKYLLLPLIDVLLWVNSICTKTVLSLSSILTHFRWVFPEISTTQYSTSALKKWEGFTGHNIGESNESTCFNGKLYIDAIKNNSFITARWQLIGEVQFKQKHLNMKFGFFFGDFILRGTW